MQYVTLGKTELRVSRVALGLALRGQPCADAAQRLIEQAIDRGITMIDCANVYQLQSATLHAHARSQEILGRALAHSREEVVITNKVGIAGGPGSGEGGCSRHSNTEQLDLSLTALGTDYVDLCLAMISPMETQGVAWKPMQTAYRQIAAHQSPTPLLPRAT